MKKNKLSVNYLLTFLLMLLLTGCGSRSIAHAQIEGTLAELMVKIYDGSGVEAPFTETRELTAENAAYYLGTDAIVFTEGAASEALITTVPHSIVLFRTDTDADIEAVKQTVKDSADPRKWICVGVDESNVVVDNIGNLVILIMDDNSAAYHKSFLKLAE